MPRPRSNPADASPGCLSSHSSSADIVSVAKVDAPVAIEADAEIHRGEIVCYRPLR